MWGGGGGGGGGRRTIHKTLSLFTDAVDSSVDNVNATSNCKYDVINMCVW